MKTYHNGRNCVEVQTVWFATDMKDYYLLEGCGAMAASDPDTLLRHIAEETGHIHVTNEKEESDCIIAVFEEEINGRVDVQEVILQKSDMVRKL